MQILVWLPASPWIPGQARNDTDSLRSEYPVEYLIFSQSRKQILIRLPESPWIPGQARNDTE